MKYINTLIISTTLMLSIAVLADTASDEHASHHPAGDVPSAVQPAAEKSMPDMQQNIQKMQELMQEIHQAKSANERQKLMQEHMSLMQNNMKMMAGMMMDQMGNMPAQADKKTDMPIQNKNDNADNSMMMCGTGNPMGMMKQMMDRMEMMQKMMEQMMQHQAEMEKK